MPVIQPKPVTLDGVTYDSYSQAEKALGLPKGSVSKRVARENAQQTGQENITDNNAPTNESQDQDAPVQPDVEAAAPDDAQDILAQDDATPTEKVLLYGGVQYTTRREMADALDVDYLKLNACLRKYDSVDEAVDRCLSGETSLSVSYHGATYRSFKALCDTYNIAPALVRQVAVAHDADRMDAFSDLATLREESCMREDIVLSTMPQFVLQGVPYRNLKELAANFDIAPVVMTEYARDMGVEDALQRLKEEMTTAYHVNDLISEFTLQDITGMIENGDLDHFDIKSKLIPMYPELQGVDVFDECYDVGPVRDSIGSGQYARDIEAACAPQQGPVMAVI